MAGLMQTSVHYQVAEQTAQLLQAGRGPPQTAASWLSHLSQVTCRFGYWPLDVQAVSSVYYTLTASLPTLSVLPRSEHFWAFQTFTKRPFRTAAFCPDQSPTRSIKTFSVIQATYSY